MYKTQNGVCAIITKKGVMINKLTCVDLLNMFELSVNNPVFEIDFAKVLKMKSQKHLDRIRGL